MTCLAGRNSRKRLPPQERGWPAVQPVNDPFYILGTLVEKDFKVRYRNMSLGVFWSLVNPLIMMTVLTFVFVSVFKTEREHLWLFVLIGLLPYNFFALAWSTGTESVVGNAPLIKHVPFQRELVPVSVVLGNTLHYLLQLLLLLIAVIVVRGVNVQWLWLPVVLALQLVFVCGLSLITSALDVYYRDVAYVVQAINLVLFWLCPIFYGFEDVPGQYAWLYEINPIAAGILIMRRIFLSDVSPGFTILKLAAVSALTLWAGYKFFVRMEKDFSDYL